MTPGAQAEAPALTTPTDPGGHHVYGLAILALTDQLNAAASNKEAAAIVEYILEPIDGLLARLSELFDAAGEKAKQSESEQDEGLDLADDFESAASDVRFLNERLHSAVVRLRALDPPPHTSRPMAPPPPTPAPARGRGPR